MDVGQVFVRHLFIIISMENRISHLGVIFFLIAFTPLFLAGLPGNEQFISIRLPGLLTL